MKLWHLVVMFISWPAFGGGVTGGGGNTHPTNPVTAVEVRQVIREARKYVVFYLNYLDAEDSNRTGITGSVRKKLFGGQASVMDVLRQVDVTPNEIGACHYADQKPVDGSATAGAHPSICISIPRLVAELSKDNLRNQVLGLLIHEYSHLVGLDETEATALQVLMLNDLVDTKRADMDEQFNNMRQFVDGRIRQYGRILANPHSQTWVEFHDDAEWNAMIWRELTSKNIFENLRLMDDFGMNSLFMSTFRLGFMETGLCVLAKVTGKERGKNAPECQQSLDLLFSTGPEITGAYILKALGGGDGGSSEELDPRIANNLYRRVEERSTFIIEVSRAKAEFVAYKTELDLDAKPLIP